MRRYLILLACFFMPICLGGSYTWTTFVGPLRQSLGLSQGAIQIPFTIFYLCFPATTIFAGFFLRRLGPRVCAVIGGIFFGSGWLLASFGEGHFGRIILGVGVLAGIGDGFAYLVPIVVGMLWFPRHKGLVTGISVAGFGFGSAILSKVADYLMVTHGASPFVALRVLGLLYFIMIPFFGSFMTNPPSAPQEHPSQDEGSKGESIFSHAPFYILYWAMFSGLTAGLTVIANLKQLLSSGLVETGVAVIFWFALGNAAGRLGWGCICDRFSPRNVMRVNLLAQAPLLLASSWFFTSSFGLMTFAFLVAFNYGGVLVIYASSTARFWGVHRVGNIYGYLFSANMLSAFVPMLAGMAFDRWKSFTLPLSAIGICQIVSVFLIAYIPSSISTRPVAIDKLIIPLPENVTAEETLERIS